jgi:hypothetical protein
MIHLFAQPQRAVLVALVFFGLVVMILTAPACATHSELRQRMVNEVRTGHYAQSLAEWQSVTHKASSKDFIMNRMDHALILHSLGRYDESNAEIETIKVKLDDLYGTQWGDELAAIAWNDAQRAFEGEEFEKVMIHLISAFNYLHLDKMEDAGVEARQINHRLQIYVDNLAKNNVKTSYAQDPFAQYLAGIIHESFGDDNAALLSYEDAFNGYQTIGAIMNVDPPPYLLAGLIRSATRLGWAEKMEQYRARYGRQEGADPEYWEHRARLVVVSGLGLVAHKKQEKWIIPDPEFDTIVVTYPTFVETPYAGRISEVIVAGRHIRMPVATDLSTLAMKMMAEKNDQVKGRAIAKAILRYAAKKVTKTIAKTTNSETGQALALLANIALNVYDMVEPADTRSWMTLPDHYRIIETAVDPGVQDVVVVHHGVGMRDEQRFILPLRAGQTRILVTRGREPGSGRPDEPARPVDAILPGLAPKPEQVAIHFGGMAQLPSLKENP